MGRTIHRSAQTGICAGRFVSAQENRAGDDVAWKVYAPVLQSELPLKRAPIGAQALKLLQVPDLRRRGAREGETTTREVQRPARMIRHPSCKKWIDTG